MDSENFSWAIEAPGEITNAKAKSGSRIDEVASVNLITDRMTGRSRGFAFVEMTESADAQKAIAELNGRDVEGRAIKVAEARPQRDRGFRDSSRGGGGRRRRY